MQYEFQDEQEEEFEAPVAPKGCGRQLFVDSDGADSPADDDSPVIPNKKSLEFTEPQPQMKQAETTKAKRGGISLDLTEKEMCAVSQYPTSSKDWAEKFKKD